jgi:Homeodomain-like domain
MRAVLRTDAAIRSERATRRDLLLETLALRHQLGVLARSNRRFRQTDRLFWLFLRWWWLGWREALVLIQPATVDRWHRRGVRPSWRRRSRRPGRPRIDSTCRDLIRRMAAENCLWGAPRIHGELLKLGITISERTVSRYLRGRPTSRSQTWRTFFVNHLGLIAPVIFANAPDEDITVDASDASFRPASSIDPSCASRLEPRLGAFAPSSSLDARFTQHYVQDRTRARKGGGRDPPGTYRFHESRGVHVGFPSCAAMVLRDR